MKSAGMSKKYTVGRKNIPVVQSLCYKWSDYPSLIQDAVDVDFQLFFVLEEKSLHRRSFKRRTSHMKYPIVAGKLFNKHFKYVTCAISNEHAFEYSV